MQETTVGFTGDEENSPRYPGCQQAVGTCEAIEVTGTTGRNVESSGACWQVEAVLQQAGTARQRLLRRLGAEQDEVRCKFATITALRKSPTSVSRHIDDSFARCCDVALADAGLLKDFLRGPVREGPRERFVAHNQFGQVAGNGFNHRSMSCQWPTRCAGFPI
jgi:hypothetical protein